MLRHCPVTGYMYRFIGVGRQKHNMCTCVYTQQNCYDTSTLLSQLHALLVGHGLSMRMCVIVDRPSYTYSPLTHGLNGHSGVVELY